MKRGKGKKEEKIGLGEIRGMTQKWTRGGSVRDSGSPLVEAER